EFRPFQPGRQEDGAAAMVCLPHLVRRLGAREARQLHHAADDEHQVEGWVTVKDQFVPAQHGIAPLARLTRTPGVVRQTIEVGPAHGVSPPRPRGQEMVRGRWPGPMTWPEDNSTPLWNGPQARTPRRT